MRAAIVTWAGTWVVTMMPATAGAGAQETPGKEAKPTAQAATGETRRKADPPMLSAGADGFTLQSAGGDYRLQLRGYVQFDGRFFPSDDAGLAVDNFLLRRVRPIFAGTLAQHFGRGR